MPRTKGPKVGRWKNFTSISVSGKGGEYSLQDAIEEILSEYGDAVYQATEEGLTAAEKVLVNNLKAATPEIKNPPKGYKKKNFRKGWQGTGKKYKLRRYVGNSATVPSDKHGPISLTNIFEYSTTRGNPFIKRTFENSIDEMAAAAVAEIKKGV